MIDLTSRQIQILKAIIEEYLETAEAVGSETIDKKYNLGISPATIRNEMAYLSQQGYLKQLHTSAGRIPSSLGLKLYVKELMNKKDLSVAEEVNFKEKIFEARNDLDTLLQESAQALADETQSIGIAYTENHRPYHAGYSHILNDPDFFDIDVIRTVLSLIEEKRQLEEIFGRNWGDDVVHIVFGEDLGNAYLQSVSIMFTDFTCGTTRCSLGVIGSSRRNYSKFVPMLESIHDLIVKAIPAK